MPMAIAGEKHMALIITRRKTLNYAGNKGCKLLFCQYYRANPGPWCPNEDQGKTYQLDPDCHSPWRSGNSPMVALWAGCRNKKTGREDKPGGMFLDRNHPIPPLKLAVAIRYFVSPR
jgi:hypothetical protein